MTHIPFIKMNGTGNDFVVIDRRRLRSLAVTPEMLCALADRANPVTKGCDQIILLERSEQADIFMRIYNADSSEVSACGNATRCVAWLISREKGNSSCVIETKAGLLYAQIVGENEVRVDMGKPRLEWHEIPLSEKRDTLHLRIQEGELSDPVGVSMGNPHAVFFVDDAGAVDLHRLGPKLEHHLLFPERANIGVAQIIDSRAIKLRVWERGAGETLACGTGACAAVVAAQRRGLLDRKPVSVTVPGGQLTIEWQDDYAGGHVLMTGPVVTEFSGSFESSEFAL